ncbi:hypothetical protein RU86_GL001942 [Lactococcus piscium]|uniref:Uncharacterized protein n=1 Tax=Pseudolactococcus piscium TaxID=1364 RepID=A0A2A5RT95_9LACT|nr:hypothetical protein [Lactococcus piscium]PCS03290.1 hypothetical protein RU86_GL001942 [Lactococcus piscium]
MKKIKKIIKIFVIGLVCLFISVLIIGFLNPVWETTDAIAFVKSGLDASTKGDTKKFAELSNINEKDLKSGFDESLNDLTQSFDTIKSEKYNKYFSKKNVSDLLKISKYRVESAKETKGGFKVKVIVSPFIGFKHIETELENKLTFENVRNQGVDPENAEEVIAFTYSEMIDLMIENIKNPSYGADKEMNIRVNGNNGDYIISDLDMKECIRALADLPN